MEKPSKCYEVGVYANDGGYRGYICDVKTNLNVERTAVFPSPETAKSEIEQSAKRLSLAGHIMFFSDDYLRI